MKYLWLVVPLLMTGCSSVRFVTVEHNRVVTQDHVPVNIVGNPPLACHYENSPQTFSGYFMYEEDGMIVLDDFGRGTIYLQSNPTCELRLDTSND